MSGGMPSAVQDKVCGALLGTSAGDNGWSFRMSALIVAAEVLLTAGILLMIGRTFVGEASRPGLWSGDIHGPLNSQLLFDPYTFTHVSHGLVFCLLLLLVPSDWMHSGVRMVIAVVIEGGWEILENTPLVIERFRETTMAQGYYGDSVLNSMGDMIAMVFGFWLGLKLRRWWALMALFIGLELVLALWIRDNLTLNLVMLLYPVPGVREWQAGG